MFDKKKLAMIIGIAPHDGEDKEPADSDSAGEGSEELESIAEEIIVAVKRDEPKALAEALKSFFEVCDSQPHEEGEHEEEESPEE